MENQEFNIYIHIGCAKAGSTTLQKHLFDKHPEINNLGRYPIGNLGKDSSEVNSDCMYLKNENLRKLYYNFVMLDGIEYRYSNNIELYKKSIKPLLKYEQINLLSNESFTSVNFSYSDIKSKADRLKEVFPNAKIIIILRNQFDMIKSKYRAWPFDPRCIRIGQPVSLDDWIKIALEDNITKFFSPLKYYEIVDIYSELFGKNNVGLFLFEELAYSPKIFASKISAFMGIDSEIVELNIQAKHENKATSHRYDIYRRLVRRKLLPSINSKKLNFLSESARGIILNFLKGGKKKDYVISPSMFSRINDYFAESNRKLENEYKLDLSTYNYPF